MEIRKLFISVLPYKRFSFYSDFSSIRALYYCFISNYIVSWNMLTELGHALLLILYCKVFGWLFSVVNLYVLCPIAQRDKCCFSPKILTHSFGCKNVFCKGWIPSIVILSMPFYSTDTINSFKQEVPINKLVSYTADSGDDFTVKHTVFPFFISVPFFV